MNTVTQNQTSGRDIPVLSTAELPVASFDVRIAPAKSATRASFDIAAALDMIDAYGIDRSKATFQLLTADRTQAKIVRGVTPENIGIITRMHDVEGFGVSIMLQEMDGKGRKTENVKAFKAVSVDGAPGQAVPTEWPGGLEPFEVFDIRPGSWQGHWLLDDSMSPVDGLEVTRALALALNADMGALNVTQPWRLAGTCHPKHNEHIKSRGRTGTLTPVAAILEAVQPQLAEIRAKAADKAKPAPVSTPTPSATGSDADKARWLLSACLIVVQGRKQWLRVGRAIFNIIGGDEGFNHWLAISMRSPGISKDKGGCEADCRKEWRLFGRTKSPKDVTLGSIIYAAEQSNLDTMAFHAAFPGIQKRKRPLEATLSPMGWAWSDNARFGAIDYLEMPYDARHEMMFIRGLGRLSDGTIPHSPADSERLRNADGRLVSQTVRYLAQIGEVEIIQKAGKTVGILRVKQADWASKPRPGDIESFHGNIVSAGALKGFTLIPNAIWMDPTWLEATPAERELCLFAIAVAAGQADKVFKLSFNFIASHTGIGSNFSNAILKRLVELDMLVCVRKGISLGDVGLYQLGKWTNDMLARVVLKSDRKAS